MKTCLEYSTLRISDLKCMLEECQRVYNEREDVLESSLEDAINHVRHYEDVVNRSLETQGIKDKKRRKRERELQLIADIWSMFSLIKEKNHIITHEEFMESLKTQPEETRKNTQNLSHILSQLSENKNPTKALFHALWELEKASANVRKALVEFENGKEADR